MKSQQRLDKVLDIARENVQEEVGALMGVTFKLSDFFKQLIQKEEYFDELVGKKVVAKIDITGEIEGEGGLVIDVKDAIRLGGTLIMLPQAELDEVVNSETYTDETEDSYGEIANIVSGAFTKIFEDNYPKNCRFIRKEQNLIAPAKVEIDSEEPIPNQWYYLVRSEMSMDSAEMGELDFLLPAEEFGLEIPQVEADSPVQEEDQPSEEKSTVQTDENDQVADTSETQEQNIPDPADTVTEAETQDKPGEEEQKVASKIIADVKEDTDSLDVKKHKKLIDKLLDQSRSTAGKEVGALLGVEVEFKKPENMVVDKEQFFMDEANGKQVLAHMDVVDDLEGKSYYFANLKDAIRIGATLIMLPPSELEAAVTEEDFSADAEDAYGEIANIIAGAYTSIFQDQYTESIRFVKKEIETVTPMKVDIESDDAIPDSHYYLHSCKLVIDGNECGVISFLLPLELFNLTGLLETVDGEATKADEDISTEEAQAVTERQGTEQDDGSFKKAESGGGGETIEESYDILIIQNNQAESEKIANMISSRGIAGKSISYSDNIKHFVRDDLKLVVIVMKDVDEQAYGVTIKVNTLSSVPIIAAGAQWTKSKVIKAVKYGVTDILLLPANDEEIQEKIDSNMLELAA